jgi:hypothetical protein
MAKGKADVSNFAIRILLQEMGKIYDLKRELPLWSEKHFPEVKAYFDNKCCYCGTDRRSYTKTTWYQLTGRLWASTHGAMCCLHAKTATLRNRVVIGSNFFDKNQMMNFKSVMIALSPS